FNTVESAAAHSHALSDFQKGMTTTRHVLGEKNSNRINLLFRNRGTFAVLPDESHYSVGRQHLHARLIGRNYSDKDVAGEQWELDLLAAIAPFVNFCNDGQIVRDTLQLELVSDKFLVP